MQLVTRRICALFAALGKHRLLTTYLQTSLRRVRFLGLARAIAARLSTSLTASLAYAPLDMRLIA